MSIWFSKRLRCLSVALAASGSLCGNLPSLTAGEAIQFSPTKGKAEPGTTNNKLPKEKLSNLDRLPSSNPFEAANQSRPAGEDTSLVSDLLLRRFVMGLPSPLSWSG